MIYIFIYIYICTYIKEFSRNVKESTVKESEIEVFHFRRVTEFPSRFRLRQFMPQYRHISSSHCNPSKLTLFKLSFGMESL